ncbi:hypothetical protein L195_g004166 [Trifolium pratense]|uniref:Uncharacterized protein n=1 Tax=Trifolium pratense TaxID=57577 RepID=A0A2K3NXA9_TRIPR|nr:hypothetical protein L195_g004166 [Trifolium pratense]
MKFSASPYFCYNVFLIKNYTNYTTSYSILEFQILKFFIIKVHPPNDSKIKEVFRYPPKANWIKCNTNRAAISSSGPAASGGILRDTFAAFFGCFAHNLGITYALHAELIGIMLAIEIAHNKR